MSMLVTAGCGMACSFGAAPSSLVVLPTNKTLCGAPAANIMDNVPMVNVMPFGMCSSMANPQVAAATAAKYGTLTPMPCVPVTAGPWAPGSPTVMLGGKPALNNTSKLMCSYAGVISITAPAQTTTMIP